MRPSAPSQPLLILLLIHYGALPSASAMGIDGYARNPGVRAKADRVAEALSGNARLKVEAANAARARPVTVTVIPPTSKPTPGTAAAPVDGKDGKPHAGPWVDSTAANDAKKAEQASSFDADQSNKTKAKSVKEDDRADWVKDGSAVTDKVGGVMNDPDRKLPVEGSTGTEGGVSEKSKSLQKAASDAKTPPVPPESPKMYVPSDKDDMFSMSQLNSGGGSSHDTEHAPAAAKASPLPDSKVADGAVGLRKPNPLPPTPHHSSASHPLVPGGAIPDELKAPSKSIPPSSSSEPPSILQPLHSFALSLSMILFSEIGDKTFLVACLMAMRHPRLQVFTSAFSALVVMTVLSAVLGHAVPTLIPERYTHILASLLFLVFGVRLLREGLAMDPADDGVGAEMAEVEQELEEKEEAARKHGRRRSSQISPYALEAGRRSSSRLSHGKGYANGHPGLARIEPSPPSSPDTPSFSRSASPLTPLHGRGSSLSGLQNLLGLLLSPIWVQTFAMTFLAEWGDRSQIATIAMAAGSDYWWVTGGAVMGHAMCTGMAVVGGKAIAGRVSLRIVTLGGAGAFIFFGIVYAAESWTGMTG